ncbi:MAG: spermidine/putrescine ABC transporter substrate-binding protein [Clostridiales bacterium]|nr:spermidine/putrescine ABC transporter substrate-binding protein [Clostridiales bacterium]
MKKFLAVVLILMMMLPMYASAQEVVNVYNWEDYIDESVLELFEQETGIHVNYMNFTTNEDMIVKVETSPGAFDLVFPSEYMVERMLAKDLLAEINYDNVPNAQYTLPNLLNPSYDPNNAHSIPYMWGTVGILYNTTMVDEVVDSWGILWDTKYTNNVFMLDSIRDSMGVTLKYLGYSMNTQDFLALEAAKSKLIEQKQSGVVKAYQVDETKDKMVAGEAALAVMWSGDAQYAIDLNPDLAYAIPKEGSNIWVDCMVIPKTAKNKENAEKFINFLCRPDIAQLNCEAIWYSSPNSGAIELMGEDYTSNTTMNPSEESIANCEYFNDIEGAFLELYNTLWLDVKNAK